MMLRSSWSCYNFPSTNSRVTALLENMLLESEQVCNIIVYTFSGINYVGVGGGLV